MSLIKRLIFLLLGVLFIPRLNVVAQEVPNQDVGTKAPIISQIEEDGYITVNIPIQLNSLLSYDSSDSQHGTEDSTEQVKSIAKVGDRVQVFDDNNVRSAKTQAQERKNMIENRFPEFRAYVQFNSPYWRVKVGDFHTRSEAEAAMAAIRSAFPAFANQLRVVRDKINPR